MELKKYSRIVVGLERDAARPEVILADEVTGKVTAGNDWILHMDYAAVAKAASTEHPGDARMITRKTERGIFDLTMKTVQLLKSLEALPEIVEIDTDITPELKASGLGNAEFSRFINGAINGVKAVSPETKVMLFYPEGFNNEAAHKWFNRFSISGGKPYDAISVACVASTGKLYDLSSNLSDLSRSFDKDMYLDIATADAGIGKDELLTAVAAVPMDKGLGYIE